MSHLGTRTIDCVPQSLLDRISSKRKLDEYDEDQEYPDLVYVKMKRDDFDANYDVKTRVLDTNNQSVSSYTSSSSSTRCIGSSSKTLHFFVRNMSGGNTKVIHANSDDTVESVHEQIRKMTGIPVFEQGLIYRGKQLQMDKTLEDYSIQNDAQLQLVGRMRSTEYPKTWKVVNQLISTICSLCRGERRCANTVIGDVKIFIDMASLFKIRKDNDVSFGHIQIFVSAGAAAALVMMFVSPIAGNKECAEEAIQLFLNPTLDTETKELQTHSVSIILEFCKLLSKTSQDNPLYISCRNTLGTMLETIQVVHRSRCFSYAEASVVIQELFPFVSELGRKVIKGLESSINSPQIAVMSLLGDVRDFNAFLIPLRNAIEDQLGGMGHLPICLTDLRPCYIVELGSLHVIFLEILEKIDECLKKMEIPVSKSTGEIDSLRSGWGQYLSILKALNTLSKLYKGAEENVLSVLRSRQVALNALIRNARRSEDHRWILEHKDLTSFESRRHLTLMLFPELKDEYEHLFEMLIDREHLLAESFEYISKADAKDLHGGGLFMEFKNEEATGPGVLREWFCLVCQAIFNPQNALFLPCEDDNRRFFPNPASDVDPLHLEYFHFCGRIIALSLVHKVQVGIVFDRTFFLQLAGGTVSLEDVRDADPSFYSSCKKILEMDTELLDMDGGLGLTFVRDIEKLGSRKSEELCPGGNNIALNSSNREEYVNLLIQHRFVNSVSNQVREFAEGFSEILCDASMREFFFRSLELKDLDRMLHGSDRAICVEDWKAHTEYNGCKETDSQIIWFWKIVEGMSVEQQRVLLFFWTSVKYLPVEGFGGLQSRLYIYRAPEPHDRLPSAHTCFYRLCLPRYRSEAKMQESLEIITQEHLSCSFGIW
ncbi:hypothetical protein C5167_039076 [Papaver somniferum]|uniref:HECT-type E3 ubiquitin transferase n=1 Tax=Papaver somniferum TaxID=3469 RepID=A0A4Y7IED5_PAPSO|nr:E3 ubiquitin-protein ligase UPL5-like [Papaver somniferum]RZC46130.1 hypothetical protein C5167_039076 [Papaver somniferum]